MVKNLSCISCAARNVFPINSLAGPSQAGGWGALAPPPVFGQTVNPISTRGGRLYPPQYYEPPRIFRPCDGPEQTYIDDRSRHLARPEPLPTLPNLVKR